MHQIVFLAEASMVAELEVDESPANHFPCMSTRELHRDARAQLYSLAGGMFLDEALEVEVLERLLTEEGPCIYRLNAQMTQLLAEQTEDSIESLAHLWLESEEIEQLGLDVSDVLDFLFQYIHFCQTAVNDSLQVMIYADG